ncbi:sensor histidine kinase [Nonomuraea sp. MCN248]|uniref:histidine kinase n=1 Tax=Nonomuraea corallina TaxID=2989783 RepID=A0ABT4SG48_9ACTN|nr:sensor histidine kinase [Nonomuraea corallina]MDA0636124.1 sensor histidine kinase [Nonomuraea corallina]
MNPLARPLPARLLVLADVALAALPALGAATTAPSLTAGAASALTWLPVAVRRIWPVPAYCGALLSSLLVPLLGADRVMMIAAIALTLYTVSTTRPVRRSAIALVPGLIVTGAVLLVLLSGVPRQANGWPDPVFVIGMAWLVVGATWSLGAAARTRREFTAREAERQAEKAMIDERLRIVRELHDVLAHSMSMITVRAGVAAKVFDKHPEEGRRALQAIEEIGRDSLVEIRQFLGALRSPGSTPESAPLPGLADLPSMADRAAEAGVQVDLSVNGTVPEHMGLSVYRIVQEAITNAVRHAAPTRCRVSVSVVDGLLRISVVDDGPGRRVPLVDRAGHGIAGMRERVTMYGGVFEAGPLPGGGFGVSASWEVP